MKCESLPFKTNYKKTKKDTHTKKTHTHKNKKNKTNDKKKSIYLFLFNFVLEVLASAISQENLI